MQVATQVRIVHGSVIAAAALLAVDTALSAAALVNLRRQDFRWVTEVQLARVHTDLVSNVQVAGVSAVVITVIALLMRRPSGKVRAAVWVAGPLVALAMLCFLVGGPEWAVTPTGQEPPEVRAEYALAVPDWYIWPHGVTGLLAAALLIFAAVFIARSDLREHYMDGGYDASRSYTSWVERTGGAS
jgi:hypothetical protein